MIESAVAKSKGTVAGPRGAATLGIAPSTLESKIKQLRKETPSCEQLPLRSRVGPRF
jgi:hypothetical protein